MADEHKHNGEEGTNAERVKKIEDKEVFAPVGIAMVMVTRSRNRPYVRTLCE